MTRSASCLIAAAAGLAAAASQVSAQSTVPMIWTFQTPPVGAPSDARITPVVRVDVLHTSYREAEDAAAQAATLAALRPSGRVAIVLQNFGMLRTGDPDHAILSHHGDDALSAPVYEGMTDMSHVTLWTSNGVAQSSAWMTDFIAEYKNQSGPQPIRFHFDNEALLSGCCSDVYLRLFDAMAADSSRWDVELLPGFGETLADLFAVSAAWDGGSATPLSYNSAYWMGNTSPDNRPFTRWLLAMSYQSLEGAMSGGAYEPIKNEWGNEVLCSNYETSCRFDGVGSNRSISAYSAGNNGINGTGLHWEGIAHLQAPSLYSVDDSHQTGGETLWDASMRLAAHNLDAAIHSFGGSGTHEAEMSPWVSTVNLTLNIEGTVYSITEADTRRMYALLRSRDIGEFIVLGGEDYLDHSCEDLLSWHLLQKVVDGVWGAEISGDSVVIGTTGFSTPAPLELALRDPLFVTAAMLRASDYGAKIEVQYTSDFDTAPCKLAAIVEGTATNGATLSAIEFYNYNTTSWDTASTDPGYLGVPNQTWRVISATDHIDGSGNMKVRVGYTNTSSFTVSLDCVQVIAFAVPYLEGDADGDGDVDEDDVTLVTTYHNESVCVGTHGDFDRDGVVDCEDLQTVLSNFGMEYPPVCP